MSDPSRVSVVIPTYNQPALLLETLDTVLAQTYRDFEIVIINDGSTDDTLERLRPLVETHGEDRIRVITQRNGGIGAARNRGLDEARGELVALLDHDDLWKPGALDAQVRCLDQNPALVGCTLRWAPTFAPDKPAADYDSIVGPGGVVARPFDALTHAGQFLTTSAMMVRKDRCTGLRFGEVRGAIEDVQFQIGLLSRGPFAVAGDEVLCLYRHHGQNFSRRPDYFSEGLRLLRQLDRDGAFADVVGQQRRDLDAYLAFNAHWATVRQLAAGRRGKALAVYFRELPSLVRHGRWKVTMAVPVMAVLPMALIRKRWGALPG